MKNGFYMFEPLTRRDNFGTTLFLYKGGRIGKYNRPFVVVAAEMHSRIGRTEKHLRDDVEFLKIHDIIKRLFWK